MDRIINIYCDESCHLPNDHQKSMVLGALCCFKSKLKDHKAEINNFKLKHSIPKHFEIKWNKVSPGQIDFYIDIINWFFDSPSLWFRGWIIPDKSKLDHDSFAQTHDDWYYKMYFYLLRNLIDKRFAFHIYLDIKDTRSRFKLAKLQEVLQNANYDFDRNIIKKMQHVHSHQIELLQVSDVLIGALSYKARGLSTSNAKLKIIELIKTRTNMSLENNSLINDKKFNICFWRPDNDF